MKSEPIKSSGSLPLDETPEQTGEKHGKVIWFYIQGRVQPESRAEYVRRHLGAFFGILSEQRVPGVRGLLVSDWLERPEALAETISEQGGPEHIYRLVDALFESRPGLRQRFVGRWLEELCEEVSRRAPSTESHAIVELLTNIERDMTDRS